MSIFALKMLSNARKKEINSLKQKKYRQRYRQFLVEGEKSVLELCQSDYLIDEILVTQTQFNKIGEKLPSSKVLIISDKDSELLSALETSPGIMAVSNFKESKIEDVFLKIKSL